MLNLSRQEILIGKKNQLLLSNAKVTIVGIGALGTVAAELLIRSGIKNLTLIDRDIVEESNLQRQTLFTQEDVNVSKVVAAKKFLLKINPDATINIQAIHLNPKNVNELSKNLILDCTDNLETRFLINDYCKKNNLPYIHASAIKTQGYVMPILPNKACLSCFIQPTSLETCNQVGVLNSITTSIAALQVSFAIKILLKKEIEPELYYYDISIPSFKKLKVNKSQKCNTCNGVYDYLNKGSNLKPIKFCSKKMFHFQGKPEKYLELRQKLNKNQLIEDETSLRFENIIFFKDGRIIIKANSEEEAKLNISKEIGN